LEAGGTGFTIAVRKNPWNERNVVAVINSGSETESVKAWSRISDYDTYSSLAFMEGKNIDKKTADSQRGIVMELRQPPAAIDPSSVKTLDDAIQGALGKKIIYVGEHHDKHSHHMVQLQVIKALYQKNGKVAVGLEMFQRPFQKVVDDYVEGTIDERTFLEKTEYFKRWGSTTTSTVILDFAKSVKLPGCSELDKIVEAVSKAG
jgi:hypothetical protein